MAKKEKNKAPDFNAPPRTPHSVHAYQLMDHAEAMLEEGDRLQASEKAWGAYIHQIKALAEEIGWPYRNTRDLPSFETLVAKLAHEKLDDIESEREVKYRAAVVDSLHKNFYGDVQPISQIRWNMEITKELIDILRRLGGNGNSAPSGNGNGTPSGSGNDGEGGSSRPPQSSGHRKGTASMGKSHRTPQMRQAKKLKGQFREQPSVPLLTQNNFPFMTQAEFDALKDF